MAKQLNIFDVEPNILQFDVNKANVKQRGKVVYADVRVLVPKSAKCTDELPPSTKQDDRYDAFEEHAIAIWRFHRALDEQFTWEAAEELCKAARDRKEAIPARVYLGDFSPTNVVEYLG